MPVRVTNPGLHPQDPSAVHRKRALRATLTEHMQPDPLSVFARITIYNDLRNSYSHVEIRFLWRGSRPAEVVFNCVMAGMS